MYAIKKKNIKIAESLKNIFMSYKMSLYKNNREIKNKISKEQSYSECRNINSCTNNEYTLSTTERTRNNISNENIFDKRIKNQKQSLDNTYLNNLLFHNYLRHQLP